MNSYKELTFYIQDEKHTVNANDIKPGTTLNDYLRSKLHLTGTKRMCVEAGCGVCIVAVGRRNPITGRNEVFAVNSCMVSIFSCYGWNIYTIEGIGTIDKPHPVQQALANFNGTQCGFCSPGMVMNMFALNESNENLTMKEVENSFGGNICRCTGYRPIMSAFKSLCKDATTELLGTYPDIEDVKPCRKLCKQQCEIPCDAPFAYTVGKSSWMKVFTFTDLLQIVKSFHFGDKRPSYMLVAGNTARGVYKNPPEVDAYVDILNVRELVNYEIRGDQLVLGANLSLTKAMDIFYKLAKDNSRFSYLKGLADHIDLIANVPVRNLGTLGGNLMMKHSVHEFPSDIFLILETAGAKINIVDIYNREYYETPVSFLQLKMSDKIMRKIILPSYDEHFKYESYKIMPRAQNAHALVNAGFLINLNQNNIVQSARLIFGNINPTFIRASKAESYLRNKNLFDNRTLQGTYEILDSEIVPDYTLGEPAPEFRKQLAISLFYKYILSIAPKKLVNKRFISGADKFVRPVSTGAQDYETNESLYPLTQAIPKLEALAQTTGEAEYIPDMPDMPNQLFASFVLAKAPPNYTIDKIDPSKALKMEGVVAFFDKNDIPGRNSFTPVEAGCVGGDEELFCSGKVRYCHQPVGIIVAKSEQIAEKASDMVEITYKSSSEKPLLTIREILNANATNKIVPDQKIQPKRRGTDVKHVVKGTFDVTWQYHYHMELQCCQVVPTEDGLDMYPSTQWMDLAQTAAAYALNIPLNKINVSIRRLGGAFGGKIFRSAIVSTACALAAHKLKKPVRMWMTLEKNIAVIGKRYPLSSDYELAANNEGIIQYLDNTVYYDYGSGKNEPVMFLLLETIVACYDSDAFKISAFTTNSDMHAACYCRAPGSVECLALLESMMEHMAYESGIDPLEFRLKNIKNPELLKHMDVLIKWADINSRKNKIKEFNKENRWRKKGLAVMPMVFPFTFFFQYNAIVAIYHADGSVALSHGGVEMGQGINTKVAQVCAYELGIPLEMVSVKPSNSLSNANNPCTGGSVTSETVCLAIIRACETLKERIKPIKDKLPNASWPELIQRCHLENIDLIAESLTKKVEPNIKNYDIYGVCAAEIEYDVLTGLHQVLRVDLLEDVGNSMSPNVDIGQVEGAFIMGLGYFMTEQTVVSENGEIVSNRTWNYKPPGAKDIPQDFRVKFPKNNPNEVGILKSKATAEPPLCLSFTVPLAVRQALASVREEVDPSVSKWCLINGPSTVEQSFMNCLHDYKQYTL